MKRTGLAALTLVALLAGCDHKTSPTAYDPMTDGLASPGTRPPDLTLLTDRAHSYQVEHSASVAAAAAATPASQPASQASTDAAPSTGPSAAPFAH